ncbi:winged helix-turn-helix domain-containing protein [Ralstonia sp. 24A2]|uniref:winged helix-turn-helix domain-containing protein n=1 Tax=Ralstonia sp. 24A2 TaxID=3447364 RepID=UPI003F6A060C
MPCSLRDSDFQIQHIDDPLEVAAAIRDALPDLLIVEWAEPEHETVGMLRTLRHQAGMRYLPIIVLSRYAGDHSEGAALDAGANDCIVKPYAVEELLARVQQLLSHEDSVQTSVLRSVNGLRLNLLTHTVTAQTRRGTHTVELSSLEFQLLHFLVTNPGRVHSRAQLLRNVWGGTAFASERTVDVYIHKLRKALVDTECDGLIQAVHGEGYRLIVQPTKPASRD